MTRAGLCETCRNVRVLKSQNGTRFYRCALSALDPAFPKYPRLPVLECAGYALASTEARSTKSAARREP